MRADSLYLWTIFEDPYDAPGLYVVRRFEVTMRGALVAHEARQAATLEEARGHVPTGLVRQPRHPSDAPHIVETWL